MTKEESSKKREEILERRRNRLTNRSAQVAEMANRVREIHGPSTPDEDNDLNKPELKVEEEAVEEKIALEVLSVGFFKEDVQYMVDLFEKGEELEQRPGETEKTLKFKALIERNPNNPLGPPIMIMRPLDRPNKDEGDYYDGSSSGMFHKEIWDDWEKLSQDDPSSERASFVERINQELDGYRYLEHIHLEVTRDKDGNPIVELLAGWKNFEKGVSRRLKPNENSPELTSKERASLLKQMKEYGIDTIRMKKGQEPVLIERLILEEMMAPTIESNAEKLRGVMTDRAVSTYTRLAYRFLTNPKANKRSVLYNRFLEYDEILKKLS